MAWIAVDRGGGRPRVLAPGLGVTVGNSCDGLTGETLVPGSGNGCKGGITSEDGVTALACATTTSLAVSEKDAASADETVAVSCIWVAAGAEASTGTDTSSSYSCPMDRSPSWQVAPLGIGQIEKLGEPA